MNGTVSVRRPRAIVFDILGTASKSGFLEHILFPFLKQNIERYVNANWDRKEFVKLYTRIVRESADFHSREPSTPLVLSHNSSQARQSLFNYVNFIAENQVNSGPIAQLRFKIWFEGYQQSKLRTPIYSDVPNRMRQWFAEGVKFYVFSNTWAEAQRALLKNTNHGDLTNLISGHYDNEFGSLFESDSWRRLCNEIRTNPGDVLFLTKSPQEGRAAADAGLGVVLVLTHRHNVKAVSREDRQRFPHVRTLNDLQWVQDESAAAPPSTGGAQVAVPAAELAGSSSVQGPIATAMSTNGPGVGVAPPTLPSSSAAPASSSASAVTRSAATAATARSRQNSQGSSGGRSAATGTTGASNAASQGSLKPSTNTMT